MQSADRAVTAAAPVVTALKAHGGDQVEVELDGARWRTVPLEAVLRAGLAVGEPLARAGARALRAELRRRQALDAALDTLERRAQTGASLERRLARCGIAPPERRQAVDTLTRAGLVDDGRYAHARARLLETRGYGDLLIGDDLERHGVTASLVAQALAALEPESARVARVVADRGLTAATLRRLAARGFEQSSLEPFVAQLLDGA